MFALTVPGQQRYMAVISAFVWAVASEADLPHKKAYRMRLAADEISTNIVNHAYGPCGDECGPIQIVAQITDHAVIVTIEDIGNPFDMTEHPEPDDMHLPPEMRELGGLGVFLITRYVDDLRYERVNGRNINRLTMWRNNESTG
ncbi:MAG: ATP-binding protein [Chloroflexota bacterium]